MTGGCPYSSSSLSCSYLSHVKVNIDINVNDIDDDIDAFWDADNDIDAGWLNVIAIYSATYYNPCQS